MRTRREVLAATAAALVVPRSAFAQAEPPKPKQLVINASGGSQIASLRENYLNDFEKETGIKIVDTSPTDFGKLRAMVESGNVVWNITEIGGQDGYRVTQMGAGRADRCQDRRPQQVPAAGADEPRVLAQLLLDRHRLSAGCISQRRAEVLGRLLGRQGVPRPAQPAQSPGRQYRGGADGGRSGAGQALSARCRSRLQEARRRSTSTSMSGGPRGSSRPSCSSTRRWCWRPGGTDASTTSSARRRRSPWSGTAAS